MNNHEMTSDLPESNDQTDEVELTPTGEDAIAPVQESTSIVETSPDDADLFLAAVSGNLAVKDEYAMTAPKRGQVIKGVIASMTGTEVLIDVGAKSEGVVSGREFESLDSEFLSELQIGDEVDAYVLTPEDRDGHIQLSLRRALEEQDWGVAEQYLEDKNPYQTRIAGYNKGGLIVRFGKLRGFVPSSQISRDRRVRGNGATPDERWGKMIGEDITIKVIEVDRSRNRLILSERAAEREKRAEVRDKLFETLEIGQVFTGRITRLADFGAFVDIGGMDGLVHISELAWKPVAHPKDVVRVGEEIAVEVINVDQERQRVGLSRKNQLADPWDELAAVYNMGQLVQGTITKLTKFGAFARLVDHPEIEGLIHISELAERRVGHPKEVVDEGQVLTLRIIRIDSERRRMGLSLKRVDSAEYMDEDWHNVIGSLDEDDEATAAEDEAEIVEEVSADAEDAELTGDQVIASVDGDEPEPVSTEMEPEEESAAE